MVFDPYSDEFQEDPYPTYARLRAETPVFYDDDWELTFFTRHADVAGILKDRRFGRQVTNAVPPGEIDRDLFASALASLTRCRISSRSGSAFWRASVCFSYSSATYRSR